VERVPDAVGRDIDLVIVDGSTNDVGVDEVLDPEGDDLAELAEDIRRFSYVALTGLLRGLRAKFSNAVVVVTGYFSPLSAESDHDGLVDLAKFVSGRPGWQLALNDVLVSPWGRILLFPLSLLGKDVDELVERVVRRAGFAHRRGLYWMRRAVAELNETETARPGLIFAHPGFRPENALFASGTPFVFEGYKLPGAGDHEVGDPMLAQRRPAIPRGQHLGALRITRTGLEKLTSGSPNVAVEEILERLADLRPRLDGPTSLLARLDALLAAPEGLRAVRAGEALPGVEAEIGRIEVSTIASFVHPNPAGARRYADVIVDRHSRHVRASVRRELASLARDGVLSVRDAARRYGFGPSIRLRSFLQHATVDALAVEMDVDALLPTVPDRLVPILLATGGGRRFPLDAGVDGLGVVDTLGTLPLGEITELALELPTDLPVRVRVEDFRFLVNGVPVFESAGPHVLTGGTPLTFPYPAAAAESGLVVEPDTVFFGSVGIGTVRHRTVRIANRTGSRIDVSVPAGSGPFRWAALDATLDHGAERQVDVEFRPQSTAFVRATLTAVHAGRVHPVRLSGKGAGGIPEEDPDAPPPPRLTITPSLVNFGPLPVGARETRTVTIENATGALVSLSIAAPPAGSRFAWQPFTGILANGGRHSIEVRFGPVPAGISTGTLTVVSSAPGSPHRIGLAGKSLGGFPTDPPA
jgi:hypothetical protein